MQQITELIVLSRGQVVQTTLGVDVGRGQRRDERSGVQSFLAVSTDRGETLRRNGVQPRRLTHRG